MDLDQALLRFSLCEPEYAGGLANHGPMAAEALEVLGHSALLPGFVDRYAPRLSPLRPGVALARGDRARALGQPARFGDWLASFESDFSEAGWRATVARVCAELAPGLFAAATHGLLRVAHALRGLERGEGDAPVRHRELAFGLAYWASHYQRLPGEPGRAAAARPPPEDSPGELDAMEPPAGSGLLSDQVATLGSAFADRVATLDPDAVAPSAWISLICRRSAALYLELPAAPMATVHSFTAPSAVRLVLPHVDGETQRRLVVYALQAVGALHCVARGAKAAGGAEGTPTASWAGPEERSFEQMADDPAETRYRAACSLDEHAIKFAEACLREDAEQPDPLFRRAAAHAALHVGSGAPRAGP